MDALKKSLVEMANRNLAMMDGTTDPVKKILDENELVFGVFTDHEHPDGVDMLVIKGERLLQHIANAPRSVPNCSSSLFGRGRRTKISAILCNSVEQAIAARRVLGDDDP